jgi:hypothetical protein
MVMHAGSAPVSRGNSQLTLEDAERFNERKLSSHSVDENDLDMQFLNSALTSNGMHSSVSVHLVEPRVMRVILLQKLALA